MSILLGLKLTLVPALIAMVTLAGRRWGPSVAGWLSAFPVVSAPILWFIAIEQGDAFAATAAAGTLSAVLAMLVFAICYAWTAFRCAWGPSLLLGLAAYACAVMGLSLWAPALFVAAPVVLVALLLAPRLYPTGCVQMASPAAKANDIPWRMAAGAALVCLVTHFSSQLGPQLSGVLAMFPVMASVLAVFSHRRSGAPFAIQLLRGSVLGYYAFAAFCLVLSLALPEVGRGAAFFMALVCAVLIQVGSRVYLKRTRLLSGKPA